MFLAIAVVRLRVLRSKFYSRFTDSAYAPVLLIICLMPTLVCIITRLPWHFSLTKSELQTKGDMYFDICSIFVTSMLPISVGIYIYWRICRKLTKQGVGGNVRNPSTSSPSAIFAINMMKESMLKSSMYACVTTAVTWLLLIVAKLSSILLSAHVQWVFAYFKILIIFTNPFCEGICMNSKKENIALLYRRHFKFNRVNIGNPAPTAEKPFGADMEMIRRPQLSLFVVDEEEEKTSPEEKNDSQTDVTAVIHTRGHDLAVCACSACMTEELTSRLHHSRSPSWPHISNQTEKIESVSETLKAELSDSSLKTCDTGIPPVCLPRHNSDGTCRIGQQSPATVQTKIGKLGRMRSDISLCLDPSTSFSDEHKRLSPRSHSSYKPYSLGLLTRMLTGIAMHNFSEKFNAQQGGKDEEDTASTVSDFAHFQNTPFSLSRNSQDTICSVGINDDSHEQAKESSAKTNFLYRPRRSLNSRHVAGNVYSATRSNRTNNEETAQSDSGSSCSSLEFHHARRGQNRRGSRLSQQVTTQSDSRSRVSLEFQYARRGQRRGSRLSHQGSVYSVSSFCPSLKSVTSVTCGYADLFEDELLQKCPSNKDATSLESQRKLLSSLSDFF